MAYAHDDVHATTPQVSGVQARMLPASWRKSSHSNPNGECVEVAELPEGNVAVRDSRDPDGPALVFTRSDWATFIRAAGELG